MRTFCSFYSHNNKIVWLSNMADTFWRKFTRCAKVCGLSFLIVLLGRWLAEQTNSGHMVNTWMTESWELDNILWKYFGSSRRLDVPFVFLRCENRPPGLIVRMKENFSVRIKQFRSDVNYVPTLLIIRYPSAKQGIDGFKQRTSS